MFLERLGPARYAAFERPATWSKHARRVAKKILCEGCGEKEFWSALFFAPISRLPLGGGDLVKKIVPDIITTSWLLTNSHNI